MPNILPENLDYIDSNPSTSGFPNLIKNIKNTPTPSSGAPMPKAGSLLDYYEPTTPKAFSPLAKTTGSTEPIEQGWTIGNDANSTYLEGVKNKAGEDMWVTPSNSIYRKNEPAILGGGQYTYDPTQPGKIIKSGRGTGLSEAEQLDDSKRTQFLRHGLSSGAFQIDHIIPLWLGGSDTEANKQILDTVDHVKKTKVQAVIYTLLNNKKESGINEEQALRMAQNWQNLEDSGIKYPGSSGMTNLKTALKMQKQWEWDKQHIPGTYGHSFGDSVKAVWKEIPQELADKTGHGFMGNLAKGFIGGATMGLVESKLTDEDETFGNKTARILGTGLSMFLPMGLVGKLIKPITWATGNALRALPKIGGMFAKSSELFVAKSAEDLIKEAALRGKVFNVAEAGLPTSQNIVKKGFSKIGEWGKNINNLPNKVLYNAEERAAMAAKEQVGKKTAAILRQIKPEDLVVGANKPALWYLKNKKTIDTGAFFGTYGLVEQLMHEGINGEDRQGLGQRASKFAMDAVTGGVFSSAGQDLNGYGRIALYSGALSLMSNDPLHPSATSLQDALSNMVGLVAMHGMASDKAQRMGLGKEIPLGDNKVVNAVFGRNLGLMSPKQDSRQMLETEMNKVVNQMAHKVVNHYSPTASTSASYPGVKYSRNEMAKIQAEAYSNIEKTFSSEAIAKDEGLQKLSHEDVANIIQNEKLKVSVALRQLDKGNMGVIERGMSDKADMESLVKNIENQGVHVNSFKQPIQTHHINTHMVEGEPLSQKQEHIDLTPKITKVDGELRYTYPDTGKYTITSGGEKGAPYGTITGTSFIRDGKIVDIEDVKNAHKKLKEDNDAGIFNGFYEISRIEGPELKKIQSIMAAKGKYTQEEIDNVLQVTFDHKKADGTWEKLKIGMVPTKTTLNERINENVKKHKANEPGKELIKYGDDKDAVSIGKLMNTLKIKTITVQTAPLPSGKLNETAKNYNFSNYVFRDSLIDKDIQATKDAIERNTPPIAPEGGTPAPVTPINPNQPPSSLTPEMTHPIPLETLKNQERVNVPKTLTDNIVTMAKEQPKKNLKIETPESIKEVPVKIEQTKTEPIKEIKDVLPKGVKHYDFTLSPDGINQGTAKIIDSKIAKLPEGSPEIVKLESFKNSITPEFFQKASEMTLKFAKGDENKAADSFINHISNQFKERGLPDPTASRAVSQTFKKIFRDSIHNKPVEVLTMDQKGNFKQETATSKHAKSWLEQTLKKELGIDVLHLEEGIKEIRKEDVEQGDNSAVAPKEKTEKKPKLTTEKVRNAFLDKGYVPLSYDNSIGSTMGLKFDSKLAGGKKITDPGAITDFLDSTLKAAGFTDGKSSINSFMKRIKSLNSHEKPSPIKGETHNVFAIKDSELPSTKDTTPNFDELKMNPVVPKGTKEDLGKLPFWNGRIFGSPKMLERRGELAGYIDKPYYIKDTISHKNENGDLFHMKHETSAWTPEEKAHFEKILGRKLNDDSDYVTVEANVKEGFDKGKDMGKYKEFNLPSEAWFMKYQNPHQSGASFSAGSNLSKLMVDVPPELMDKMVAPYKAHADAIKGITEELQNFKGPETIDTIWKKYPEFKKNNFEGGLYGELKTTAEHGAGVTELGQNLNKVINQIVTDQLFKGRMFKGDVMHVRLDTGLLKTDPKTGEKTHLNSGEAMVSEKSFLEGHSKEEYDQLKKGREFTGLFYRYPVLNSPSIARMKIIVAENNGVDIGKNQVVLNSADKFGKFNADEDGDTLHYMNIGGKAGVPEEIAKHFDSENAKGEMYFPQLKSSPKIPWKIGEDTYKKITDYSDKNLNGGEAVGIAAASSRPMREWQANDGHIVVGATKSNKTKDVKIIFNGKPIKEWTVKTEGKDGENLFPQSPESEFTIKPKFGDKEAYDLGFMGQAAVDVNGKSDLPELLKPYNGNASAYVNDLLWSNAKDSGTGSIVYEALKDFQAPYQLDKPSLNEKGDNKTALEKLAPSIEMYKKIKANGGKVGIAGEIALNLENLKPIDSYANNPVVQTKKDNAGSLNVISNFKVGETPSIKVANFKNFYKKAKISGKSYIENIKDIEDEYKKIEKTLSKDEKKEISFWVATNPGANMYSQQAGSKTKGSVKRVLSIMNKTPEIAKTYWQGHNEVEIKPSETLNSPNSKFTNLKNSIKK